MSSQISSSDHPIRKCAFKGCHNTSETPGKHLFEFPKDPERFKLWVDVVFDRKPVETPPRELYTNSHLCSDHFEGCCFVDENSNTLVYNAIPFAVECPPQPMEQDVVDEMNDSEDLVCNLPQDHAHYTKISNMDIGERPNDDLTKNDEPACECMCHRIKKEPGNPEAIPKCCSDFHAPRSQPTNPEFDSSEGGISETDTFPTTPSTTEGGDETLPEGYSSDVSGGPTTSRIPNPPLFERPARIVTPSLVDKRKRMVMMDGHCSSSSSQLGPEDSIWNPSDGRESPRWDRVQLMRWRMDLMNQDRNDPDANFFRSLLPYMRKLSATSSLSVKSRILNILEEEIGTHSEQNNPQPAAAAQNKTTAKTGEFAASYQKRDP